MEPEKCDDLQNGERETGVGIEEKEQLIEFVVNRQSMEMHVSGM